jgi:hypothetical protein
MRYITALVAAASIGAAASLYTPPAQAGGVYVGVGVPVVVAPPWLGAGYYGPRYWGYGPYYGHGYYGHYYGHGRPVGYGFRGYRRRW